MGTNIGAMSMADLLAYKTTVQKTADNKRNLKNYVFAKKELEVIKGGNYANLDINAVKNELAAEIKTDLTKKVQDVINEYLTGSQNNKGSLFGNIFKNVQNEDLLGLSNVIDVVDEEFKNKPLELLG